MNPQKNTFLSLAMHFIYLLPFLNFFSSSFRMDTKNSKVRNLSGKFVMIGGQQWKDDVTKIVIPKTGISGFERRSYLNNVSVFF